MARVRRDLDTREDAPILSRVRMGHEHFVGGRFEPLRLAGAGGMGRVFEAHDRFTDARVALKVLQGTGVVEEERFAREARALATLQHPGVVRYVAHGTTGDGELYLAMDWVEGETLSARLRRGRLDLAEALCVAARLAEALGAVHRAGLVHRDLKPANVMLADGALDRPVLVDFGLARVAGVGRLTSPGTMLGTPGYMAPEQARGETDVDARADVFSLGCVLFRCLTGEHMFAGEEPLAALLRLVLEEPRRVRELRPELPEALDALVARLLAKERDARPADGEAVAAALEALGAPASASPASLRPAAPASGKITASERRLTALVLVRDDRSAPVMTWDDTRPGAPEARGDEAARRARALRAAAARHEARVEVLADDALLVTLASAGAPTDLCARAARCALAIRAVLGEVPVAVVTGWAEIEGRLPAGEIIERALGLLAAAGAPGAARPVLVDETTARLLGPRFDVRPHGAGRALNGELDEVDEAPPLLGRPTACVGRDRELTLIETTFAHCAEEPEAAAVLVTAPSGMGKSRLRQEMVRRLRARGEPIEVWVGHADPLGAGAAFGLLSRAVRHALGIAEGDPPAARQRRIRARTGALPEADRVAAFLAELTGAPLADDAAPQLRAARRDPVLMGDQLRRAAEDLLRSACAAGPVVLVLEDLQWGDLPSVTFVDAALRNLAHLPLLVLALARPEVHGLFPQLWAARPLHELRLGGLPRRGAERLVRQALGATVSDDRVQALLDRAEGNAFYLEELIRAVAEGQDAALPESVLAMTQARLEGLSPEARRVLRAASVFGLTFSAAGVEALLGGAPAGDLLAELVQREVLVRRAAVEGAGEVEHGFRHALVREAAYAMLTESDRALGHQLAGAWLEQTGHGDAMMLAEHFERGGEPARAAGWYRRAAEEALQGDDLVAALERADRGAACGAGPEDLGAIRLVQAEARLWRGELAEAEALASEAAALLPRGSAGWYRAMGRAITAAGKRGSTGRSEARAREASAAVPGEGALGGLVLCLSAASAELTLAGRYAAAGALLSEGRALASDAPAIDDQVLGMLHEAEALMAHHASDHEATLHGIEAALAAYVRAGDRRSACASRTNLGFLLAELGDPVGAEAVLRDALADAEQMGLHDITQNARQNLGHALTMTGRLEEARRLQEEALQQVRQQDSARMEGISRTYLARVALLSGDAAAAEREAQAAAELLQVAPSLRATALALLARSRLAQGRAGDALGPAEEAFAQLEAAGSVEEGEALVRLAHAEALEAAGRRGEALAARAAARARLLERAARLRDPGLRERFLTQVPDHAATLTA